MRELDREEISVLREIARAKSWTRTTIFRSGGGEWMAAARQRLKRLRLLESHREVRRTWRATDAGRAALSKAES